MPEKNVSISKFIIFVPMLLVLAFTVAAVGLIDLHLNEIAFNRYEKDLVRFARNGARMLAFVDSTTDPSELTRFVKNISEDSGAWVAVTDREGNLLGESHPSPEEVWEADNTGKYPTIPEGLQEIDIVRHFSHRLNADILYITIPFDHPRNQGYLRVAQPLTDLEREKADQRLILGLYCLVALIVAVLISLGWSRYLFSLVKKGRDILEERVGDRTRQLEMLENLSTQLAVCNSLKEVLQAVRLVAARLLPGFRGSLALLQSETGRLAVVESWNGTWPWGPDYAPDQCWALRAGRPHLADPAAATLPCAHAPDPKEKMLCIPLMAHGEALGVLHISPPGEGKMTPQEHRLALAVAEHTTLSLAGVRLRENLRQQAIRDPLTALYNRRYLLESMEHELSRAMRRRQQMGVLMMDLDHFKKFNDTYGHKIGDFILSEFGRLLKTVLREEDTACRYGGEEFTVLLPETDREGTRQAAEKIRVKIREHAFLSGGRAYGPITTSIGGAVFPEHGTSADQLLKQADDNLYRAKQAGRDRVVVATD